MSDNSLGCGTLYIILYNLFLFRICSTGTEPKFQIFNLPFFQDLEKSFLEGVELKLESFNILV